MKNDAGFQIKFPEWLIISALVALLTLLMTAGDWLWRADHLLYDAQLRLWRRPPPEDIVLVSIDDASLRKIGDWPWSRGVHAQLIGRLSDAGARVIAMDILFSEKSRQAPQSDQALVEAVAKSQRVVLPMIIEQTRLGGQLREILPFPELSEVVAAMGHVHVDLDKDGIARQTYLKQGLRDAYWPSLAVALLRFIEPGRWEKLPGARSHLKSPGKYQTIRRDYQVYIAFAGPPGHFPRFSYSQVLDGLFLMDAFKDKIVLVGGTATGLVDSLPTPVSGFGQGMSGIEITANLIDALRRGILIQPMAKNWRIGLSLLFVLLPLFIYPRLTPRSALLFGATMFLVVFGFSYLLLHSIHFWFPPAASLLGLLVGYPLWSWRRLEHTSIYLNQELHRLRREPFPFKRYDGLDKLIQGLNFLNPIMQLKGWSILNMTGQEIGHWGVPPQTPAELTSIHTGQWSQTTDGWWIRIPRRSESWLIGINYREKKTTVSNKKLQWLLGLSQHYSEENKKVPKSTTELFEKNILEVRDAIAQIRTANGLLSDIVSRMADGLIVADPGGQIILANNQASRYLGNETGSENSHTHLLSLTQQIKINGQLEWQAVFNCAAVNRTTIRFEARHISGTELFLQVAPWIDQAGAVFGIIVTLSDITSLKVSEHKRAETLSFLSHDLRSPLTSLLSIVQTQGKENNKQSTGKLIEQVEHYTTKALKLADEFLQMARAENIQSDQLLFLNMVDAFHNAADEAFSTAHAKQIQLKRQINVDEAWISGDMGLLERALGNLIENAIRHSAEKSHIELQLFTTERKVHCCIKDSGEGIPEILLQKIFDPFLKLSQKDQNQQFQTGLGLAFVKTVAEKHMGKVTVESQLGVGSCFCLILPLLTTAEIKHYGAD